MAFESALKELRELVGKEALVTDSEVLLSFAADRSGDLPEAEPVALLRACSERDVVCALEVAQRYRLPVVARGAGSSLAGGACVKVPCLVISTEQMKALTIDEQAMTAEVEPGVLNIELKQAAREKGLWYPPDPSSYEFCTIGGNIATNAGGLCCVRFGVTGDYVLALRVVLPGGKVLELGRAVRKNVAGYDLKRLFIGSEGTLGIITRATLRLIPYPEQPLLYAASYSSLKEAADAIVRIIRRAPAVLEFMDRQTLKAINEAYRAGLDEEAACVLLAGGDSTSRLDDAAFGAAKEVISASTPEESEEMMRLRRSAIPAVEARGGVLIEDVGVPPTRIAELLTAIDEISAKTGVELATIGHAGEGNFHPLLRFEKGDRASYEKAMEAFGKIAEAAISLGGTITGEHGVGTIKRPWLSKQLSSLEIEISLKIKEVIDPYNIMNPGKLWGP